MLFVSKIFLRLLFLIVCLANFFVSFNQELIWQTEAETGTITGTAEIVTSCSYASGGGEFVRLNSDPGNTLVIENIEVTDSGFYRLKIYYFSPEERPLEVLANEVSAGVFYLPAATWCFQGPPAEYVLNIYLNRGQNTLSFNTSDNASAPFIDKLTLTEIFKPGASLRTSANRILQGQYAEVFVELNDVSTKIDTVYLEITGHAIGKPVTRDTAIIFLPGKKEINFLITNTENMQGENVEVILVIDIVSSGLSIGNPDSLFLSFVNKPSAFYISNTDGNDQYNGKIDSPWKSLERASGYSYVPGDSVLLKSGETFNGQLKIQRSGTKESPIYFGSYGAGPKPIIDGANANGGAYTSAVLVTNVSHIVLDGMEVTNNRKISRPGEDDQIAYGINVYNEGNAIMADILIRDLDVKEVYAVSIEGIEFNSVKVAGIQLHSKINSLNIKAGHIRDVIIENCFITHTGKYGIWSRHEGAWQNVGNDTLNRNMNIIICNNHFFETGGAGVTLSRTYNALLENNLIENSGSDFDPRMVKRGSGAWFWKSNNILAQYNTILHTRGPMDSYGIHVDWGNRNVFIQYNYTEDTEGGFVEILGDNINSVYRFNVSVNDGFRDHRGNTIWISRYAGRTDNGINYIPSDSSYIYNNTIYVEDTLSPGIEIRGKNTFIYNNIFYALGDATMGDPLETLTYDDAEIKISNNLFFGKINPLFTETDEYPVFGDPFLVEAGAKDTSGYRLLSGSIAVDSAISFREPIFPLAGKAIFSHVSGRAEKDMFGNPVNIQRDRFNIGASNEKFSNTTFVKPDEKEVLYKISIFPNPADNQLNIDLISAMDQVLHIKIVSLNGKELFEQNFKVTQGENNLGLRLPDSNNLKVALLIIKSRDKQYVKNVWLK